MHIRKRTFIRIISYLTAAIAALGFYSWQTFQQQELYRLQLEYSYLRSLQELSSNMAVITSDLDKGTYAGTPKQLSTLSTKLWREAGNAKTALTSIPVGEAQLDSTYRFLSQVGDYAMAIARKASSGQEVSQEEKDNLVSLVDYSRNLEQQISQLEQDVSTGKIKVQDILNHYWGAGGQGAKGEQEPGPDQNSFKEMEASFEGFPQLIYDGPFSTHLTDTKPKLLEKLNSVSREQARSKAATAAGVKPSEISFVQDENSNMPSYCFASEDINVGVTKQGGLVTYMSNSRQVQSPRLSVDDARAQAEAFLKSLGVESMESTYYEISNNICTINYAYRQQDIICYTDLIKVGVAMDNGQVVFYDGRGFISNHKERVLPAPSIIPSVAAASVSPNLAVTDYRLALIPSPGQNELLTYEFKCLGRNNQNVLVYVNATTGEEEQILILVINENGVLTV